MEEILLRWESASLWHWHSNRTNLLNNTERGTDAHTILKAKSARSALVCLPACLFPFLLFSVLADCKIFWFVFITTRPPLRFQSQMALVHKMRTSSFLNLCGCFSFIALTLTSFLLGCDLKVKVHSKTWNICHGLLSLIRNPNDSLFTVSSSCFFYAATITEAVKVWVKIYKNHDVDVHFFLHLLIVAFSRLELTDNIVYILQQYKQSSS